MRTISLYLYSLSTPVEWVIRLHSNVRMKKCLYLLNTWGRNKHGKAYTSCLAIISWEGIILKNIWKSMKNIMNLKLSTCKAWILDHWSNQVSVTMQVNLKVMWKGTWMSTKTIQSIEVYKIYLLLQRMKRNQNHDVYYRLEC
jgi:hypothetical protein